jgi:transposase
VADGAEATPPVPPRWHDYKNRDALERALNHLKNWRGIAPRYDKHAMIYHGGVGPASILLWLT